ncbi:hypothetical protein GCM10029964_065440 [Kibdelosporangium lantanae]
MGVRLVQGRDDRVVHDYNVDAGLYLFDHRRFRELVVPAFRRLHGDDEVEPWLAQVWSGPVPRFTPYVRRVTASLMADADLAGFLPAELEGPPWLEWGPLCDLMLTALERTCLGEGVAVGGHSLRVVCGRAEGRAAAVRPRRQAADGVVGGTVDRVDSRRRGATGRCARVA